MEYIFFFVTLCSELNEHEIDNWTWEKICCNLRTQLVVWDCSTDFIDIFCGFFLINLLAEFLRGKLSFSLSALSLCSYFLLCSLYIYCAVAGFVLCTKVLKLWLKWSVTELCWVWKNGEISFGSSGHAASRYVHHITCQARLSRRAES